MVLEAAGSKARKKINLEILEKSYRCGMSLSRSRLNTGCYWTGSFYCWRFAVLLLTVVQIGSSTAILVVILPISYLTRFYIKWHELIFDPLSARLSKSYCNIHQSTVLKLMIVWSVTTIRLI